MSIQEEIDKHKTHNKLYHVLFWIFSILLHGAFLVVLYYSWRPIAEWYLGKFPIRGIDFFNTVTYVRYLRDHTVLRFTGWKDLWFGGYPLATDYPGLHFYLMLPFVGMFGLVRTVEYYVLATIFLYGAFSYLLFYQVSKLRSLSFVLAAAVLWSVGPYGALVWGGSLPFFATQMFYPLAVYFLVCYLKGFNKRWFYASILVTSVAVYGHPLVPMIYTLPTVAILLMFWNDKKTTLISKKKFKDFIVYVLGVFAVGFADVRYLLVDVLRFVFSRFESVLQLLFGRFAPLTYSDELNVASDVSADEAEFAQNQLSSIITQTNQTIFIFAVIFAVLFVVTILFRKKKLGFLTILPGLLLSAYVIFYIALYAYGIPFFHGGWYRTFWAVPVIFGLTVAWLGGEAVHVLGERLNQLFRNNLLAVSVVFVFVHAAIIGGGVYGLGIANVHVIEDIDTRGIASSAFPDRLNILSSDEELAEMKSVLVPDWVEADNRNYRLYSIDATVNIWWNSLFNMPLARGYIDPPLSTPERWGLFWLDSVMGVGADTDRSSLEADWDVPAEVVDENTKFLLDWFAIRYLEGDHGGYSNSRFARHVTSEVFVNQEEMATVSGTLMRYETKSGKEEWNEKGIQNLHYYRVKKNLTSPIISASKVPVILLIGSDAAYDTMMRFLGMINLNSQYMLLVKGPKFIDDVKLADLTGYDGLILYDYDYRKHDKAWAAVEGFVKNGGSVFVDTGVEVKESDSINLPASFSKKLPSIFPLVQTVREDLGRDWDVKVPTNHFTQDIPFEEFSPLVFDEDPWNVSHPEKPDDVEDKAEVILYLHDYPVVVSTTELGGKVIWSGLNLPYHVIREYNTHEAEFLKRLLGDIFGIGEKLSRPSSKVHWLDPQNIVIETNGAKGVLVKQQVFDGWQASVTNQGRTSREPILIVGPSSPGFMFIRTQPGESTVKLSYKGDPAVLRIVLLSGIVIVYLLDAILFNGKVVYRATLFVRGKLQRFMRRWWVRDEE